MNEHLKFAVPPTMTAPTAAITRVDSKLLTDCSKCESNINVGIFFDGTNNNRKVDKPELKHSNVARLFDAYSDEPATAYFRSYIPGVGTAFPEIREVGTSKLGNGCGIGCERRVLYGLLHVFNAIHMSAHNGDLLLTDAQVMALCCNYVVDVAEQPEDNAALGSLGLTSGLGMPPLVGDGDRVKNLKTLAKRLEVALVKGRPRIKECFLDVFGFSRGAAEARVFCSWLDEILTEGKLAGVIVHFRFVGLMDTVASAGFFSSLGAAVTGADGGHSGWAESRYLRIPKSVQNCVHMIAAHELRKNFPLDTIIDGGKLPPNCQEFVYPGTHSDVGGGYAPGELGIAFGPDKHAADAHKLAQIPLNHMLECAIAAGAPLKRERAKDPGSTYDPFALSSIVHKAYDDFVTYSTLKPRAVHEWLQPYLNWRWEVRKSYTSLNHVRKANEKDRALLLDYNARLIADAAFLANPSKPPGILKTMLMPVQAAIQHLDAGRARLFEEEASAILAIAKAASPTEVRLHTMFDLFVHDSLAGFDHNSLELSGYWRYRRGFVGDAKRLVVENAAPTDANRVAA